MESDRNLVEAVVRGDRGAFALLVERYQSLVVGVATDVLRDKHAAEDAAQEAFVTAFERLASLRDGAAFGCWLMRIARRAALLQARRQRRVQTLQVATGGDIADRAQDLDERSKELLNFIQRLPEHERLVVMLKYFDGHSVRDISEIVGKPVGSVTKELTRARCRLEQWFKESEK